MQSANNACFKAAKVQLPIPDTFYKKVWDRNTCTNNPVTRQNDEDYYKQLVRSFI